MTTSDKRPAALITGASSGIGATYAERLAARGHDLVLVARDGKRLKDLAARLTAAHGISVDVVPADLSVRADVRRIADRLRDDAAIGLLVNNAGIGPRGALLEDDLDYLDTMIDLNVGAVNTLAVTAAKVFSARGAGGIINIASVVAIIPERFHGTYNASKAFVLNLTQALATDLSDRGVRVQAVLPGLTRTEIFDRAGGSVDRLPQHMVMEVGDMVDAALAGFDQGELVTIPSLPDAADWQALTQARMVLGPNLSHDKPAARYGVVRTA